MKAQDLFKSNANLDNNSEKTKKIMFFYEKAYLRVKNLKTFNKYINSITPLTYREIIMLMGKTDKHLL